MAGWGQLKEPSAVNWKNARRSLPFAGRASWQGSKLTAPCPHCGSRAYGYHGSRFKDCPACGYDRALEKLFDIVRDLASRDRLAEMSDGRVKQAIDYYQRVYRAAT